LAEAVADYLRNPAQDRDARRAFVEREVTYTDGSAGNRTSQILLSLMERRGV